MPNELEKLAERVEREPVSKEFWSSIWADHFDHEEVDGDRFYLLLCAGAWRDAAAMLMPEGWFCDLDDQGNGEVVARVWELDHGVEHIGAASGPHAEARARCAAALRARAIAGRV